MAEWAQMEDQNCPFHAQIYLHGHSVDQSGDTLLWDSIPLNLQTCKRRDRWARLLLALMWGHAVLTLLQTVDEELTVVKTLLL